MGSLLQGLEDMSLLHPHGLGGSGECDSFSESYTGGSRATVDGHRKGLFHSCLYAVRDGISLRNPLLEGKPAVLGQKAKQQQGVTEF